MSKPRMIIRAGGIMRRSIILIILTCLVLCLGAQCLGQSNSCGCNTSSAPRAGETVTVQLTVDDIPRSYLLYVPKSYNPGNAIPLIVAFHGWTDTASGMARGSGLTKTADAYGFAVAFPEGINYPAAGRGWAFPGCYASPQVGGTDECGRRAVCEIGNRYDCDTTTCPSPDAQDQGTEPAANLGENEAPSCSLAQTDCVMDSNKNCNWCGCVDDEAFTRGVVKDVSDRMCIDLAQIHATGMSAGGMMTSWLIGQMHDVFAAYAPMSGTNPRDFYNLPPANADISVMWIHGTRDSTVPHDGSLASDGYLYEAAEAEVERVAEALGCSDSTLAPYLWNQDSVQAPSNADLNCKHYQCLDSAQHQIAYCLWDGGHNYPKQSSPRESALWG
ncbi:MAG TPA: PHB depolymerase family esterase, partial [Acidobacteriota bacterium]|nr:PHB depolymerase family esterase [Acidobacteriota bacterium]